MIPNGASACSYAQLQIGIISISTLLSTSANVPKCLFWCAVSWGCWIWHEYLNDDSKSFPLRLRRGREGHLVNDSRWPQSACFQSKQKAGWMSPKMRSMNLTCPKGLSHALLKYDMVPRLQLHSNFTYHMPISKREGYPNKIPVNTSK